MPIKAYTGLPRAGKSYEVVVYVILPALRAGRRVVSNIAGLNYDAMCQVLYAEGVPHESIGELVCVTHDQVSDALFWRTDTDDAKGVESFVQAGDVVALDEVWRFWKKRGDIHPRTMNFMRMHAHFAHPVSGFTCEVAIITQHVRDINENVRAVVEQTFVMVKNTKLGSSKSYVVHIYDRDVTRKTALIRTLPPRIYKAEYFPCYKSHSQRKDGAAEAVEANPDGRGNIFGGLFFRLVIPAAIFFIGFTVWGLFHFFHRPAAGKAGVVGPVAASGVPAVGGSFGVPGQAPFGAVSSAWRVMGFYKHHGFLSVLLVNAQGGVRSVDLPRGASVSSLGLEIALPEGERATSYTVVKTEKGVMR